jgi:hypothetical protein
LIVDVRMVDRSDKFEARGSEGISYEESNFDFEFSTLVEVGFLLSMGRYFIWSVARTEYRTSPL